MKDMSGPQQFATTHWSLVGAANLNEASQTRARDALEELCRAYWYPLYAFVRSRGYSATGAQDLTQAFFARIIETSGFASANRKRGSFWILLILALLFGLGEAFVTSSTAALVADICEKHNYGSAMGTFGTLYDIGHASGPILAGVLIASMNFINTFAIIGSILIVAAIFFALTVKENVTV